MKFKKKTKFYTIIYWCYIDKWKKFPVAQKIEKKNSWITNITKKKNPRALNWVFYKED